MELFAGRRLSQPLFYLSPTRLQHRPCQFNVFIPIYNSLSVRPYDRLSAVISYPKSLSTSIFRIFPNYPDSVCVALCDFDFVSFRLQHIQFCHLWPTVHLILSAFTRCASNFVNFGSLFSQFCEV